MKCSRATAASRCKGFSAFHGLNPSPFSGLFWWLGRTKTDNWMGPAPRPNEDTQHRVWHLAFSFGSTKPPAKPWRWRRSRSKNFTSWRGCLPEKISLPKVRLNYRPNGRRLLGRSLKRIIRWSKTGLLRPDSWRIIIIIVIIIIIIIVHFLLLHSSLAGSQNRAGITEQALLFHCSAENFTNTQHVLSIAAFCIRLYRAGRRSSSFRLLCNFGGIIPFVKSRLLVVLCRPLSFVTLLYQ